MEQFRQIGEVLGSLKALMVFKDDIQINGRQCCLLVDAFNLAFESIADAIKQNLSFDERLTKWKGLEHPLRELHKIFKEGEQYIKQCLETKNWWARAIALNQSTDCVDFHLHNLLWCVPVVLEAIENIGEITGCDQEEIQRKRLLLSKKYEEEWIEPNLFQLKYGKQYLVSQDLCSRFYTSWKEDQWLLSETVAEKRGSLTKQKNQFAELLVSGRARIFPSSILASSDYQVRRRLEAGGQYKEAQWMGESFAVRHFFGEVEPLKQDISLLQSVSHPNVMHVMYAFADEEKKECFLVMELMNKDLYSHIKEICSSRRRLPFNLLVAVDTMLQIARGMEYLHSRKIFHGELNPSNILVKVRSPLPDGYLHVRIGGFGLSMVKNLRASVSQTATDPCIWYAPEVLSEQEQTRELSGLKFSEKADVYSFAMICFELLTGKVPFEDSHLQGDKMSRNIRAGERPLFPFPSPKYLTSLTKRCWHADPMQRPSFTSICRVLRYVKKFLVMNPDHSQPDPPLPPVDYFELELSLCKRSITWAAKKSLQVSEIPLQMFAYRVVEREKTSVSLKEKNCESGSEGASIGDENAPINIVSEDSLSTSTSSSKSSSQVSADSSKKGSAKKSDGKTSKQSGTKKKAKSLSPSQLTTCGHSLRMSSESQMHAVVISPRRRQTSGPASGSS